MATIITKNSSTASSVPTNAQLVQGELAVNVTDKRLFTENASGTVVELGTNPSSLTLPNGSVNGIPYLNGSKVLTTNSALQFDGSNLGLGVTPSTWTSAGFIDFIGNGFIGNSTSISSNTALFGHNAYFSSTGWRYKTSFGAGRYQIQGGDHYWYSAPSGTADNAITFTQAMRLNSDGVLLVGTTSVISSSYRVNIQIPSTTGGIILKAFGSTASPLAFLNSAGTTVGGVDTTNTATTYNTSSDYRLKNSIAPMTGALAKVAALKPCTYKWKADGSDGEGFIAHELAEVCPQAVTGEKDAVDAEGNPQYQGIDTSFLVATLTAAIQELKAEFDAYKASHP